jgi:hypothetical protein
MRGVDLDGIRRILPAHVGCRVDLVGSRRMQSDRLDDHRDDQRAFDSWSNGTSALGRSALTIRDATKAPPPPRQAQSAWMCTTHRAGERPGDAADRLDAGDDQLAQLVDVVGLGKGDHVVWNRRRLKRRSTACCGRRRAGRNTAATARVALATAHAGGSPVTLGVDQGRRHGPEHARACAHLGYGPLGLGQLALLVGLA